MINFTCSWVTDLPSLVGEDAVDADALEDVGLDDCTFECLLWMRTSRMAASASVWRQASCSLGSVVCKSEKQFVGVSGSAE
jgi:hypothetical protein